jgi:hypothetical protein
MVVAWGLVLFSDWTERLESIRDVAPTVAMIAALALVPVQLVGSAMFDRATRAAEAQAKETDRLNHFRTGPEHHRKS